MIICIIATIISLIAYVIGLIVEDYTPVAIGSAVLIVSIFILLALKDEISSSEKKANNNKQDSIWITAHDGKRSNFNPQTNMDEIAYVDSLGQELLLIKVKFNKKK